jgi:hypothetical protein
MLPLTKALFIFSEDVCSSTFCYRLTVLIYQTKA